MTQEGDLLFTPSADDRAGAHITRFLAWLREYRGLEFETYEELWRWSVTDLPGFWSAVWDFFEVRAARPYTSVLSGPSMPGARWFEGAELNYAEHALARRDGDVAVVFRSEQGDPGTLTFAELADRVAAAAAGLRRLGVGRGDRVAAYAPNIPETLVAFLATASLGAIWSSCSPDFGVTAVVDRFRQIGPTVLLAVDEYRYGGKVFDRRPQVAEIQRQLPTLAAGAATSFADLLRCDGPVPGLTFEPVPFDHALWVLYSSGTTGLPKALVHGHGGILLEHLKSLSLQMDLGPGDRFFWYTSTGWMMWNLLVGGLLAGATVVLYDGSPGYPDLGALWRLAEQTEMTYLGVSAPYLHACMKAGTSPRLVADLGRLRSVGSTGAPLSAEGFGWVYENVGGDLRLGSVSGGTDVCSGFVGSCPLLPVHAGEIQCRYLGASVQAYDASGQAVVGEVGELVVTEPMPSMPLFLWGDPDGARYRSSYFESFPGVWRHGDWVKITDRGTCVIYGRSDSTLNRAGVRIGTSELYRVVEALDEVADSLVVDTGPLRLFVVLAEGVVLDEELRARIAAVVRTELSPRHVPDEIVEVPDVPRTLNGKKMEVPVKRILAGERWQGAVSADAMANPDALRPFLDMAAAAATRP